MHVFVKCDIKVSKHEKSLDNYLQAFPGHSCTHHLVHIEVIHGKGMMPVKMTYILSCVYIALLCNNTIL